jgi:hypothetical protein
MVGENERVKLAVKNELEKRLPAIRKRTSALPDVARMKNYGELHAQLIWFEIDVRSLRDDLYALQNQEALSFDTASTKPD